MSKIIYNSLHQTFTKMLGLHTPIKHKTNYLIIGTGKAWAWQRSANPVPSTLLTWIDLYSRVNEGALALIGSVYKWKRKVKQKTPVLGYKLSSHNNNKKPTLSISNTNQNKCHKRCECANSQ